MDALPDKWFRDADPADRPEDVAASTLQDRLGAVLVLLPLAATRASTDVEHVHQLRVWTRRASAALKLYHELLPRRRSAWMKKQLCRIRHAVNSARNCDVLIERLKQRLKDDRSNADTRRWLKTVRRERADSQESIEDVCQQLQSDNRFARRIDRLVQKVGSRGSSTSEDAELGFQEWAVQQFRPLVQRFFATVPSITSDAAELHRFRIRGKELRYAIELLAAVLPPEFQTRHYPVIVSLQDRLGVVNDIATSKVWLKRKLDSASNKAKAAQWSRLLTDEQQLFDQECRAFREWWSPQMLQELEAGMKRLPGDTVESAAFPDSPD